MLTRTYTKSLALLGSLCLAAGLAVAQDSGPLIDLLVKKGVVNDQEAEQLRADLIKDFNATTSAGKLNLSPSLTELKISGDVRIRYENRTGQDPTGDTMERDRLRYRIRPSITGKLGSDWLFGFRLEASGKARSSNGTFGDDAGPWNKTNDTVNFGQVYVGYTPNKDLTVWAGRMPNPFVCTSMVWDGDINPEGFAEQYKTRVDKTDITATFGQFVYDGVGTQNGFGTTATKRDQYLLGWQLAAKINVSATDYFQIAPTIYNYVNNGNPALQKTFVGPFKPTAMTANNDLQIVDVPFEYSWTSSGSPMRVFGDIATNLKAGSRATKYGRPDLSNQKYAYQFGYQIGKAKLKGEWDAKAFYQQSGLFSLDQNLVDSDLFDSRVNMKGVVFNANYQISDAVTASFTYANGRRTNATDFAANAENDIGTNNLNRYNLLQLDLVVKF